MPQVMETIPAHSAPLPSLGGCVRPLFLGDWESFSGLVLTKHTTAAP